MAKTVSLGIMEQSVMRQESINAEETSQIKGILDQVTHVEGKYLGTLDLLKERIQTIGGGKPLILHAQYPAKGDDILNMVNPAFKEQLGDEFARIINMFDPEVFSFHLGFSCEQLKSGGQFDFATGLSEVLSEDEVRNRILDNVAFAKKNYLKRGEIILENLDYNPKEKSGAYEYVCDPVFIDDILTKTGCRMLLDIGHANCSAQNMGRKDVMSFMQELPLEKVFEIHMSGAGHKDGLAHDTHHPITDPGQKEVEYLDKALKTGRMTSLSAVTLETFEQLDAQLDILRKTLESNGYTIAPLA